MVREWRRCRVSEGCVLGQGKVQGRGGALGRLGLLVELRKCWGMKNVQGECNTVLQNGGV